MKKNIGVWNETSLNERWQKLKYENKNIFNEILRFIFICATIFIFWWITWEGMLDIDKKEMVFECNKIKNNLKMRQDLFNPSDETKKICAKYDIALERRSK